MATGWAEEGKRLRDNLSYLGLSKSLTVIRNSPGVQVLDQK